MPKYVAFLRAINITGRFVKMERLRALFEALGFGGVETFIASGNVVFEAPSSDARGLEQQIEQHLEAALGFAVATLVRSPDQLARIAQHWPFSSAYGSVDSDRVYVAFLPSAPDAVALSKLASYGSPADQWYAYDRELYWLVRPRLGESKFSGALLERTLRLPATVRNVTTVRRMAAKYCTKA